MSRLISEMLQAPEPVFSHTIHELEMLAGKPGIDIKLAHEMRQLFRIKAGDLNLDENDTTLQELYYGLAKKALDDSDRLAEIIDIKETDSPKVMAEKSIAYVEKRLGKRNVWGLKPSTARKQLKENPPKKLMKILSIRSIDSALKRERPSTLYCLAHLVESSAWQTKYVSQAGKLTNSDFDYQTIDISLLAASRQRQLNKAKIKLSQVTYAHHETASIEVAIMERRFRGDVLFLTDSLLNHVKNILKVSTYFKYQGFRPDFFSKIELMRAEGLGVIEHNGAPFGWSTLLHATSDKGISGLIPSTHESHLSAEDFVAPSIHQLGPFEIWKQPFALYGSEGIIVSSNLSDMIINAINRTAPVNAYVGNGRENLRHELFARYLHHQPVQEKMSME